MKDKIYRDNKLQDFENEARRSKTQKAFSLKRSQIMSRKDEQKENLQKRQMERINL